MPIDTYTHQPELPQDALCALNAIKVAYFHLAVTSDPADRRTHLVTIRDNADRLMRLVTNIIVDYDRDKNQAAGCRLYESFPRAINPSPWITIHDSVKREWIAVAAKFGIKAEE